MNERLLTSEKLARSTILIKSRIAGGQTSTGTGFYYHVPIDSNRHVPVVVTNRHVVAQASEGVLLHRLRAAGDAHDTLYEQKIDDFESQWIPHPDPNVDLCALGINDVHEELRQSGGALSYVPLTPKLIPNDTAKSGLDAVEHVLMIGYPQGLWDSFNNMPVIRRGITATHPRLHWQGKKEFLIDAACFPGSSGSPVFLHDVGPHRTRSGDLELAPRLMFLGILYAGPYANANISMNVPNWGPLAGTIALPANLGFVIQSDQMIELGRSILGSLR
jgi:hypothetical protein